MKPIQRNLRLDTEQKVAGGVTQIYAQEPGGMRKIRCPKCQNIAAPSTDMKGTPTVRCMSCGTQFQSIAL